MFVASSAIQAGALVGERLGKYDVLALLAIGGTAEIYLARIGGEAGFEKYVVIKCLLDHLADEPDYVRMFLDEARLCAQLHQSNIVQTLELGEHRGQYYMVMEYLAGMSLAQLARKTAERVPGGLLPIDVVLSLAAQTAGGLHYAHEKPDSSGRMLNVVHRDVSPQNLVVTFDGILKIVDFGIAKAEARQTQTRAGTIKGKFAYMSPEQCQAQDVDRTTDVFALGVIVHELLTGRRLFKRGSSYETYQVIVAGKYPAPSRINHHLDAALDTVVMNAVAFDRKDRYQTAEAFGEALLALLHRRGKSIGAADVARYYDQHFEKELDEHASRMRQLIEGRVKTVDQGGWSADDGGSPAAPSPARAGPPRAEEADEGATRVELNPLERVRSFHEQNTPRPGLLDTKEKTRPAGIPRGKSIPKVGGGSSQGPTKEMKPPRIGESTGDATTLGRKKAMTSPSGAATKPKPFKMPPIGAPARGSDDATRELVDRNSVSEQSGQAAKRPTVRPPQVRQSTAETRDVLRPGRMSASSPVVGDGSFDEDEEAATVLRPDGFVHPGMRPPNISASAPGPKGAIAAGGAMPDFGAPNPGEVSTSEKTRPAMDASGNPYSPASRPLFSQSPLAAKPPSATSLPTQERIGGPGNAPPAAPSQPALAPPPSGQGPSAFAPAPGPGDFAGGPPFNPTGSTPPSPTGPPPDSGGFSAAPNMGHSGVGPMQPPQPSYSSGLNPALAGPDSGALVRQAEQSKKPKMRMLTLGLVFVISVGIGLLTTLLLFR